MASPIEFPEQNIVFAKDQPEYLPLPAQVHGDTTLTIWELSQEELEQVKTTGKIYLSQMNFNQPLQPVFITGKRREIFIEPKGASSVEYLMAFGNWLAEFGYKGNDEIDISMYYGYIDDPKEAAEEFLLSLRNKV